MEATKRVEIVEWFFLVMWLTQTHEFQDRQPIERHEIFQDSIVRICRKLEKFILNTILPNKNKVSYTRNITMTRKNVPMHETFIMFIPMFLHIGIRKTRNTDDSLGSGTKLLLPSLSLGFSTRGERDKIFLCWLFVHRQLTNSLTQPMRVRTPQSTNWTGLAQVRKINSLQFKSQLTAFIQNQ